MLVSFDSCEIVVSRDRLPAYSEAALLEFRNATTATATAAAAAATTAAHCVYIPSALQLQRSRKLKERSQGVFETISDKLWPVYRRQPRTRTS